MNFPIRYVPTQMSRNDQQKQIRMLLKSKELYKKHKYYTRKSVASFKNKPSGHVENARKLYGVETGRTKNWR